MVDVLCDFNFGLIATIVLLDFFSDRLIHICSTWLVEAFINFIVLSSPIGDILSKFLTHFLFKIVVILVFVEQISNVLLKQSSY